VGYSLPANSDALATTTAVPSRIPICLLLLGMIPVPASADWLEVWRPPPLTTAQQVRYLSSAQAREGRPVKLSGVVTHVNADTNDFWVQDATAGIYVHPTPLAAGLLPGDRVEIEAVTDAGAFSPCVVARRVARTGTEKLPDPQPFNLSIEDSRWLDGQWVQASAVVWNARASAGVTLIDVISPHGRAVLVVPGEENARAARELRSQALVVRGVCAPVFKDRRVADPPRIYLSGLPKPVRVPGGPPGEPDAPPRMIDHLLQFSPHPHPGARRVKIAGVVTATPLANLFALQDGTGGAAVWTETAANVAVGDRVEAYGLLHVEGVRIALMQAQVTRRGAAESPAPVRATVAELAGGARDAVAVRLEGRVEEVREVEGWTAVGVSEDGARVEVFVPGTPAANGLARLEIGSRVAAAGVPVDISPDRMPTTGPGVYLPSGDAFSVLEPPARLRAEGPAGTSWWTTPRAGYMIGGFATVVLLGGGWLVSLRVQVRRAAGEVKRQFEEKSNLERQLRQASKLEVVGRLAGGIAHDFNNLLTVINGCAELLAEEVAREGGRFSELTDDIRKAGERAAALTGQLLSFSRKRDILITALNLNDVVADTVQLLGRLIGEDIRIVTDLAPDLPAVRGEPSLLHQVTMNLAVNARDAMPHGGTLTLATSLVTDPNPGPGYPAGSRHFVRLTVEDTGTGISDEVKARLFEPFFTTKEVGRGTGQGLAMVNNIVKTFRGRIRVDSVPGRGTRFSVDLRVHGEPISDAELSLPLTDTPLPLASVARVPKLAGATVLVVEDNEMVRATITTGLRSEGATVLAADRPENALRVLAEHPGAVNALVTDVVMPGMSGSALADQVRKLRPDICVVFMSGHTSDEVVRKGVREEQVEFLQKPFTPDQLIRRLVRVLARDGRPT
jgi:two-component system cell cycle sensor histidine kinase/response regulator CckA